MAWAYRLIEPPSGIMFSYRFEAPSEGAFWAALPWCKAQYGRLVPQNKGLWTVNTPRLIWLLRENDAFAFRMRWC